MGRGGADGEVVNNWLTSFHDDQLTAAVAEAIANNPDLRVGAARVEPAMMYAKLAGAKLWPSVDILAKGGAGLGGDSSGIQGALLTAVVGDRPLGTGPLRPGSGARGCAIRAADFEYSRESMAAAVAKSWFLATEAGLQAEVARASIRDGDQLVQPGAGSSARRRRQR